MRCFTENWTKDFISCQIPSLTFSFNERCYVFHFFGSTYLNLVAKSRCEYRIDWRLCFRKYMSSRCWEILVRPECATFYNHLIISGLIHKSDKITTCSKMIPCMGYKSHCRSFSAKEGTLVVLIDNLILMRLKINYL